MADLRSALAEAIRSRVMGDQPPERALELMNHPGPRWFEPDRPIWTVHADSSMFIGGLRTLLLQSMHPLAMAGVAQHSDYRHDPWGRLQRTADFLTSTTFGPAVDAERAVGIVRKVHERVTGVAPDGRLYSANDPHLLAWVHIVEVDSFLQAHQRYGQHPLLPQEADGYVADMAVIASALGVVHPPTTVAGLKAALRGYQPELRATKQAREAARFLLTPPVPAPAIPAYAILSAAAIGLLPWWARVSLWLPVTPILDRVAVRPAGSGLMSVMRWALTAPPTPSSAPT